MERFWEELGTWGNEMKGFVIVVLIGASVAVIALALLTAAHANDNLTMRTCLENHTPKQCKVMELNGYEFTALENE